MQVPVGTSLTTLGEPGIFCILMVEALLEVLEAVRSGVVGGEGAGSNADAAWLDKLVRRHNRAAHDGTRQVAKRRLLPFYLRVKAEEPAR